MTHIIRQQHLHIEVRGNETEALTLPSRLSRLCQDRLNSALDSTLNRYVPETEHWFIDNIVLNVGEIALDNLEQELPQLIIQALETSLRTQRLNAASIQKLTTSETIQQQSTQQHLQKVWLYFLSTGRLPWYFKLPPQKTLEQLLLDSWQNQTITFDSHEIIALLNSDKVRKRLITQFSNPFLMRLLQQIAPKFYRSLNLVWQCLANNALPKDLNSIWTIQIWQTIFICLSNQQYATDSQIIQQSWQTLPNHFIEQPVLINLLEQYWQGITQTTNLQTTLQPISDSTKQHTDTAIDDLSIQQHIISKPHFSNPLTNQPTTDLTEGIYIDNAGLVLLHPFLPQFFRALNIANDAVLLQTERALCLLHFLSTGQQNPPEYELVLAKLLCNIALDTTVNTQLQLTDTEIEEANALLTAVIKHWSVLKNTSIDGLRGTFLLRAGKLTLLNDGDWRLQVETQTFDILLDQLPWGISMIKLPWMQQLLWVEWN